MNRKRSHKLFDEKSKLSIPSVTVDQTSRCRSLRPTLLSLTLPFNFAGTVMRSHPEQGKHPQFSKVIIAIILLLSLAFSLAPNQSL